MTLKKHLDEMNDSIKRVEKHLLNVYPLPFKFEHFEWKHTASGYRIFYKKEPLLGSKLERRIEASPKIEGLVIVATKLQEKMIKKLDKATAALADIGNHGND